MTSRAKWLSLGGVLSLMALLALVGPLAGTTPEGSRSKTAKRLTLFSFDNHSIPFKDNLYLTMAQAEKYPGNPVVPRGPAGSVDSYRAQFYGSVIREGEKFRMWYAACHYDETKSEGKWAGNPEFSKNWHVAYAESNDGIHWVKPNLGLTSFKGSTNNNLVELSSEIDLERSEPIAVFILHEPDDPDPGRRYKMAVYGRYQNSAYENSRSRTKLEVPATIYPYFSADGLRWKLAMPAPKKRVVDETEAPFTAEWVFEIGGLYKFDGIYYVAGQEISPDVWLPNGGLVRRTMTTHWSGDFIRWSQEKSFSFQRYGYRSPKESLEEAHEGASVWNRGNVLLGLFGLWHGAAAQNLWRLDLGFLVSNDGIHFREPVADHVFVKAGEGEDWDRHGLIQGQGFENVGDKTYIYYGTWDLTRGEVTPGAIGLATLRRDGFGYLSTRLPREGSFTTVPLTMTSSGAGLFVNADGLGEKSYLSVELIDKYGTAIPGYSGTAAALVKKSGLREKVNWPGTGTTIAYDRPYRVRVHFAGSSVKSIKFYGAYLE